MNENNENQNIEQNEQFVSSENIKCISKESHSNVWKFILIIIAIFLGTFAAVYTVVDMTMYRLGFKPFFSIANQIEKVFDEDMKFVEKSSPAPVKIETKDDKYVVTVNMKSFDNKRENFDIVIKDNGVTIKGEYKKDKNGEVQQNSFYQNVIFPQKIDEDNVKTEEKGHNLIITLPFKL